MEFGKKFSKTPREIRDQKNKSLRYNMGQVKIIKMKIPKFTHFTDL